MDHMDVKMVNVGNIYIYIYYIESLRLVFLVDRGGMNYSLILFGGVVIEG